MTETLQIIFTSILAMFAVLMIILVLYDDIRNFINDKNPNKYKDAIYTITFTIFVLGLIALLFYMRV